jgi:hypothetical protein
MMNEGMGGDTVILHIIHLTKKQYVSQPPKRFILYINYITCWVLDLVVIFPRSPTLNLADGAITVLKTQLCPDKIGLAAATVVCKM